MSDTHFDLPDDLKRFVEKEIVDGRFSSPDEVIRAGLALLEERESRLAALRTTIADSERASAVAFLARNERY